MNPQYGKLSFKKRINKINQKQRPNSSCVIRSVNYSISSTFGGEGGRKKSINNSKLVQLNNSCMYNNTFLLPSKNNSINISESYISTKNIKNKDKNALYEESIKLKTKINKLKKELDLAKSNNHKKDEEIKKREKAIEIAKNKLKENNSFGNLKEENIIIKLKDNYQILKSRIKKQVEENNKLQNEIKQLNINDLEKENNNNLFLLKDKIDEYNVNLQFNLDFNNELNLCYFDKKEFINNHTYIEKMQKIIDEKSKKIKSMKENLQTMKDKLNQIEENRKRIISYNDSIKKQNERLLIDKKKREDFILKKPIILGKINEYETKAKNFEDKNKNNEIEIEKLDIERKKLTKQIKDSEISKPIDYDKLVCIEKNPKENINQKILLLESLIKESKDRQNEFIEIFAYYDDYVRQKENYELINNEAKLIEEKNNFNNNNNNQNSNDNLEFSPVNAFDSKKSGKDDEFNENNEEDISAPFLPSSIDSNKNNLKLKEENKEKNKNIIKKYEEDNENKEKEDIKNSKDLKENKKSSRDQNINEIKDKKEKQKFDIYQENDETPVVNKSLEIKEKKNQKENKENIENQENDNSIKENPEIKENKKKEEINENQEIKEDNKIDDNKETNKEKEKEKEINENNIKDNENKEINNKKEITDEIKDISIDNKDIRKSEDEDIEKENENESIKESVNPIINSNNLIEKDKTDNKKKNEKKLKNFKLILSIMFIVKKVPTLKVEKILLNYNTSPNDNNNIINDDLKNNMLNISKDILNLIDDNNENDIKTLKKIMTYLLEEKYQNNKELFFKNIVNDLISKNKLTFGENEDEENQLLGKIVHEYSVKSKIIIEKMKKDGKKYISYKNIKKILKEEQLYIKNNKEKTELFKFFIYVLKKNISLSDENISIFDFISEDIMNFFNGIYDIVNDKKNEENNANEEGGLTITDEEFRKIINKFINDFNTFLNEKNLVLNAFLGEDNINIMIKDEKEIEVINVYKFVDILNQKGFQLNDNFIISCIFAKYQIDENLEDIDLTSLENDLKLIRNKNVLIL